MIRIEPDRYGSKCNNCGGTENVKTINVSSGTSKTYCGLCLCKECRLALAVKLRKDLFNLKLGN